MKNIYISFRILMVVLALAMMIGGVYLIAKGFIDFTFYEPTSGQDCFDHRNYHISYCLVKFPEDEAVMCRQLSWKAASDLPVACIKYFK